VLSLREQFKVAKQKKRAVKQKRVA